MYRMERMAQNRESAYEEALQDLAQQEARPERTTAALIRRLLPKIEQALERGYTLTRVWQALKRHGLALTYQAFHVYVSRARKRTARMARAKTQLPERIDRETKRRSKPGSGSDFDPLHNVQSRVGRRSGFQYRGSDDLADLVHGTGGNHGKAGE
jgi:hypothetical protein